MTRPVLKAVPSMREPERVESPECAIERLLIERRNAERALARIDAELMPLRKRYAQDRGEFLLPTVERLRKELLGVSESYVHINWARPDGRPWTPRALRELLQAWAKDQGAQIVPHGLRKNAVNALLHASCSIAETAAISGQTMQIVEHYAKQRDQGLLSSAAILKWEAKA